MQNIKALGLPLSEKNSEICLLCSYARTCDPNAGPVLTSKKKILHSSIISERIKFLVKESNFKDFALSH